MMRQLEDLVATDELTGLFNRCHFLRLAYAVAEPMGVNIETLNLSAGMTLLDADDDLDEALQRAGQALYRAKRSGRNRCDAAWEWTRA